ncbi:MAG: NAD-dependent deacylase [Candidatus Melainabacteria bacterium]|nr:NAD-dependent deacylase [Candidatus Melainabacteria bacterium]
MDCLNKRYSKIVFLTGAGVSAASELPTYRGSDGLWTDPETARLATAEVFEQDPQGAWRFWSKFREQCLQAKPNPAHLALSDWSRALVEGQSLTLVTQNIDGLHQRAGSPDVLELHGSIFRTRCSKYDCTLEPFEERQSSCSEVPHCPQCCSPLRPDIVLFGESLPPKADWLSKKALRDCDLFIAVGTSGSVSPASGFVHSAKFVGAKTILVNLEPMHPFNPAFEVELLGRAENLLPRLQFEFFFKQTMIDTSLPPANVHQEQFARERFDITKSPDEQAARYGHLELLGSPDQYRYSDQKFDAWIHRYYRVICTPQYLRICRLEYLTQAEIEEVENDDGF